MLWKRSRIQGRPSKPAGLTRGSNRAPELEKTDRFLPDETPRTSPEGPRNAGAVAAQSAQAAGLGMEGIICCGTVRLPSVLSVLRSPNEGCELAMTRYCIGGYSDARSQAMVAYMVHLILIPSHVPVWACVLTSAGSDSRADRALGRGQEEASHRSILFLWNLVEREYDRSCRSWIRCLRDRSWRHDLGG